MKQLSSRWKVYLTSQESMQRMKLGANHPMGPLELGDFIGLDICLAIMDVLYKETGDSKYRACPLIRKMVFVVVTLVLRAEKDSMYTMQTAQRLLWMHSNGCSK